MSFGDLIMGAMNGGMPATQLANALSGGAQQPAGGFQGAPGSPQPSGGLAQPQATQSPADMVQLYGKLINQSRAAEGFDRGLAEFLGGFKGPPGGAERLMNAVQPQQDVGAMLQNMMQLRQTQAMMGAQAPAGISPALWNLLPPDARAKLATDVAEQQAGIGGPPAIQERQRDKLIYMKEHGITDPNDPRIPRKYIYGDEYAAAGTAEGKQAGDIAEYKDSAVQDYGTLDPKLEKGLASVNQLLGDKTHSFDDTMTALTTPKPTTGKVAANMPSLGGWNPLAVSQSVKDQAVAIETLKGQLSAEAMSGVKNIRNQREFKAIVDSLTASLDAANSPDKVKAALENIRGQLLRARAIATASAGHKLTGSMVGHLGQDEKTFLDPSSPYYNGGTQDSNDFSKMNDDEVTRQVSALSPGAIFIGPDGQPHTKN